MTKSIDTLVHDVKNLLQNDAGTGKVDFDVKDLGNLGVSIGKAAYKAITREDGGVRSDPKTIYASEVGGKCLRQLWYKVNMPHLAEALPASARFKFLYGDIIEETFLTLAELAGHSVTNKQMGIELTSAHSSLKIRGRIDAFVDDRLIDVKSVSSIGFSEFEKGQGHNKFGYGWQLGVYGEALGQEKTGFIYIDRMLGHFGYVDNPVKVDQSMIDDRLSSIEQVLTTANISNDIGKLSPVAEGASGNMKLCTECSYCPYKESCWSSANGGVGLRKFAYSNKVMFLTEVKKVPKVTEIT